SGIGANWGTQCSHPLPPDTVVKLLKDNRFRKVKLFDADYDSLRALGKSGIEVMVGIPNDMLPSMASSVKAAEKWVAKNVSTHITTNYVNIRFVAVGNQHFLETYNVSFLKTTFLALQNVQIALIKAGLSGTVMVTVPLNDGMYESSTGLPSGGDFRADIRDQMLAIFKFLIHNNGVIAVNINPFISLYTDPNFPIEYVFFDEKATPIHDGGKTYYNMFDANYDTLVWALNRNGFGNLPITVGEIGWPTGGDQNANIEYAKRFNQGFLTHILGGNGTPMRPGMIDAYLYSLIDEDAKSIDPGSFERHWGMFNCDGSAKYQLNVKFVDRKRCVMKPSAKLDDPHAAPSVGYDCGLAVSTGHG
ncbi:glucan endo-1, partial [Quercus suber]